MRTLRSESKRLKVCNFLSYHFWTLKPIININIVYNYFITLIQFNFNLYHLSSSYLFCKDSRVFFILASSFFLDKNSLLAFFFFPVFQSFLFFYKFVFLEFSLFFSQFPFFSFDSVWFLINSNFVLFLYFYFLFQFCLLSLCKFFIFIFLYNSLPISSRYNKWHFVSRFVSVSWSGQHKNLLTDSFDFWFLKFGMSCKKLGAWNCGSIIFGFGQFSKQLFSFFINLKCQTMCVNI